MRWYRFVNWPQLLFLEGVLSFFLALGLYKVYGLVMAMLGIQRNAITFVVCFAVIFGADIVLSLVHWRRHILPRLYREGKVI